MTSTHLHRLFWGSFVKASMCSEPTLFQVLGRHKQRLLALQNTDKFIILLNKALGGFMLHTADYKFEFSKSEMRCFRNWFVLDVQGTRVLALMKTAIFTKQQ